MALSIWLRQPRRRCRPPHPRRRPCLGSRHRYRSVSVVPSCPAVALFSRAVRNFAPPACRPSVSSPAFVVIVAVAEALRPLDFLAYPLRCVVPVYIPNLCARRVGLPFLSPPFFPVPLAVCSLVLMDLPFLSLATVTVTILVASLVLRVIYCCTYTTLYRVSVITRAWTGLTRRSRCGGCAAQRVDLAREELHAQRECLLRLHHIPHAVAGRAPRGCQRGRSLLGLVRGEGSRLGRHKPGEEWTVERVEGWHSPRAGGHLTRIEPLR